jgi:hypothetical protein
VVCNSHDIVNMVTMCDLRTAPRDGSLLAVAVAQANAATARSSSGRPVPMATGVSAPAR